MSDQKGTAGAGHPAPDSDGAGDAGRAGEQPASTVVADSVSVLDSLLDYLAARLRLEGYRLERQGRTLVGRLLVLVALGVVALMGLVFVSVGAAELISTSYGSRPAGPLIVGGFYLVAGLIALGITSRARS